MRWGLSTAVSLLACVATAQAQRPERPTPMIVVFEENTRFADFAAQSRPDDRTIADPQAWSYLNPGVVGVAQMMERRGGFRAGHVFSQAIQGFSAALTPTQIRQLQNDSLVRYVEPDRPVEANAQVIPWGISRIGATLSSAAAGNGTGATTNVHVYIIDTGVAGTHPDLNLVQHVNFAGGQNADCNGHGTHVAGTIAARDNSSDVVGVVPGAPIHGVKVLSCTGSGSTSTVIKGIDWVTSKRLLPAVANLSLGGSASQSLDDAVIRSAAAGVLYTVAAGNNGANACNYSPARAGTNDGVVTVAATDSSDLEASFSNFGSCVDLWAPGVSILSTRLGGGTTTMSGTSMAAPHAAGSAALFLSTNSTAKPSAVEQRLKLDVFTTLSISKDGRPITLLNSSKY